VRRWPHWRALLTAMDSTVSGTESYVACRFPFFCSILLCMISSVVVLVSASLHSQRQDTFIVLKLSETYFFRSAGFFVCMCRAPSSPTRCCFLSVMFLSGTVASLPYTPSHCSIRDWASSLSLKKCRSRRVLEYYRSSRKSWFLSVCEIVRMTLLDRFRTIMPLYRFARSDILRTTTLVRSGMFTPLYRFAVPESCLPTKSVTERQDSRECNTSFHV